MRLRPSYLLALSIPLLFLGACKPVASSHSEPSQPSSSTQTSAIAEGADAVPLVNGSLQDKIRARLQPDATVVERDSVQAGLRELTVNDELYYTDTTGRYLIRGEILDLETGKNLTQTTRSQLRENLLKTQFQAADAITYGPSNAKHHLTVFTDVECGYCRKFHEQIKAYTDQGISISYYPWPRSGLQGQVHDEMVATWCASDRQTALTNAKAGNPPKASSCPKGMAQVAKYFQLGKRLGVQGTPAIFLDDGTQIGGYVPPEQILTAIDQARVAR